MPRKSLPFQKKTGAIILKRIAQGEALASICQDAHIPSRATVYKWLRENPEFRAKYETSSRPAISLMEPVTRTRARALGASATEKKHDEKTHGRPSEYSTELADLIIEMLLEGQSMRAICARVDMPSRSTIFRWMEAQEGFRERYELAKRFQADLYIDEITEIADDKSADWVETEDGERFNKEAVMRARLRVDTRFKMAEKLFPKRFGPRITQELTSPKGAPLLIDDGRKHSAIEVARRIAFLLDKGMREAKEGEGG